MRINTYHKIILKHVRQFNNEFENENKLNQTEFFFIAEMFSR